MLRYLFSFQGVNWWTLLGGVGLNFVITIFSSLAGAYFATNEATGDAYQQHGALLMMLVIFITCGIAGFVIAKIADDVPVKHAFLSSLGAFVPFLAMAVLTFTPMLFLLAAMATAGNLNGGMLAIRRRRYVPPRDDS